MRIKRDRGCATKSYATRPSRRPASFGALILSAFLILMMTASLANASNMGVVLWGQADPRWSSIPLGTGGYTMGQAGCALTAASMVANYYGSTKNPGQVCQTLNAGGFNGLLNWSGFPSAAGGSITYAGHINYPGIPADMNKINSELDAGYPVIVGVKGYTHYIVITGHDGGTYYINDSGGPTIPYGRQGTFGQWYGSPAADYIDGIFMYHGTHTPPVVQYNLVAPGDAGFTKGGTPAGWYPIGGGIKGTGIYTYGSNAARDAWGRWTFDLARLSGTARYRVEAYVTSTHAGHTAADYHINASDGIQHRVVNQNVYSNQWVDLGTYALTAGSAWVELDDQTTLPWANVPGNQIAFDGMRLTYVGPVTVPNVVPTPVADPNAAVSNTVNAPATTTPKPTVHLTRGNAPKTMYSGSSKRVTGYLKPRHTAGGTKVQLRLYKYSSAKRKYVYKGHMHTKLANYSAFSKWVKYIKFSSKGKWRIRAYMPADSKHAATFSRFDYVTVK